MDAGEDDAILARAVVEHKLQQLLGLLHRLARLDLDGAEVRLGEGVKVDLVSEQRLDLDLGEVDDLLLLHFGGSGFRLVGLLGHVQRLHRGEEDDVADGVGTAEHHRAAVDAEAQAARRGQTVFEGHDVILVHHLGLVVAVGALFDLRLEALVLIHRVVELSESVAHLAAADEHLVALGEVRVRRAALGKRAHFDGVHGDERRLDEGLLDLLVEGLVQGVAPGLVHAVHVDADALGERDGGLGVALDRHKVRAGHFLDGVSHRDALPRRGQVNVLAEPPDLIGAEDLLRGAGEDGLEDVHHAVEVRVGLIELAGGKLGVMLGVHTLVAEDAADLVHALHAADDQAL